MMVRSPSPWNTLKRNGRNPITNMTGNACHVLCPLSVTYAEPLVNTSSELIRRSGCLGGGESIYAPGELCGCVSNVRGPSRRTQSPVPSQPPPPPTPTPTPASPRLDPSRGPGSARSCVRPAPRGWSPRRSSCAAGFIFEKEKTHKTKQHVGLVQSLLLEKAGSEKWDDSETTLPDLVSFE